MNTIKFAYDLVNDTRLALVNLGLISVFFVQCCFKALSPPWNHRNFVKQIDFIGFKSLLVIFVAGAFVGMVVALQFHATLVRFGSVGLMGSAVGLSLIRELGPVLTALILIGRAGSAICAEIGIMRNDNQIDALESMAIDPLRYLVVPRMAAFLICGPLLTAIFTTVGIFGGCFISVFVFDLNQAAYFHSMANTVQSGDLAMGFVKSIAFSVLIVWLCTASAYLMHQRTNPLFGAEGVSKVTTGAVVSSSIVILFADYIISALMV
ncbi:MAG: MlaE family ABC transporter permease [Gammaproteobacteria bacterium]